MNVPYLESKYVQHCNGGVFHMLAYGFIDTGHKPCEEVGIESLDQCISMEKRGWG